MLADGQPVAIAVAETVLTPSDRRLATTYGSVEVIEHYAGTGDTTASQGFAVSSAGGAPLVEVRFDPDELSAHRRLFLWRVLAVSLLPLPLGFAILATLALDRRRQPAVARLRWARWWWSAASTAAVAFACAALARLAALPPIVAGAVLGVGVVVVVSRLPDALWWQASRSHPRDRSTARFVVEQAGGGLVLAVALEIVADVLDRWMTLGVLERGPFVLFPLSPLHTASAGTVLLAETAIAWMVACVLAALAIRWSLVPVRRRTLIAAACWWLPSAALVLLPGSTAGLAGGTLLLVAAVAVGAGLGTAWLRRVYRHTTQSIRLLLGLLAGLIPLITLYPLAAVSADRATRDVVESIYAPATAGQPQELLGELERAQARIDAMTADLATLVGGPASTDSQPAFLVWSQTGLERSRVISDVELYGPDRELVSRFAFNLPEYIYRSTLQPWQGASCRADLPIEERWEVFGETPRSGRRNGACCTPNAASATRPANCSAESSCMSRWQRLPGPALHFFAQPVLRCPRRRGIRTATAGSPTSPCTAGVRGPCSRRAVPLAGAPRSIRPPLPHRRRRSGRPSRPTTARYHVHFSQNRAGIYALGYPELPLFEHATRLAEIAGLAALLFVVCQVGRAAATRR